ncbi:MAG TPA: 3-deoxy-7-phosphoheptulonate synthase [Gemmatimonadaceae bacterium]
MSFTLLPNDPPLLVARAARASAAHTDCGGVEADAVIRPTTLVRLGQRVTLGDTPLAIIAGPCSVEGREMLLDTARAVRAAGAVMLRGGAFKPRTSPYSFQGLGPAALEMLDEARALTGLPVVTEVLDPRDVALVAEHADMLQVGARNMQNYALLAEVGESSRPVLLKRGPSATLAELLYAAEHVLARGNAQVVLCERGIRTFETSTRYTLDVGAIPMLKAETHLPVIVDPSHAGGRAALVEPLALAAVAAGADGLIVEVHPSPAEARSDGDQSLTPTAFASMMRRIAATAAALGRELHATPAPALPAARAEGAWSA